MARHSWDKLAEHSYRCRCCGMSKRNDWRQTGRYQDEGQWIAIFERAGQRTEGRTPPCPGRPDEPPGQFQAPIARPRSLPEPASEPEPERRPAVAAPSQPSPRRPFSPLLAGPSDPAADAYRATLQMLIPIPHCAYCVHSQLDSDRRIVRCGSPESADPERHCGPWPGLFRICWGGL